MNIHKNITAEQIKAISKNNLIDMYERQNLSVDNISSKINISSSTIFHRLKLYNIKVRKAGRRKVLTLK